MHQRASLDSLFRDQFPTTYMGHSVHFSGDPGPETEIRVPAPITKGPVSPLYWVDTPADFLKGYLGLFPTDAFDWLALSEHRLLGLASGQLFVDGIRFSESLEAFRHYPHDVRLHLIASQWTLIAEERAFTKRCAMVGDDVGSRLVCARIVEHLMRLCFLYANRYAPYSKWFGTAFSQLSVPEDLRAALADTLASDTIARREPALVRAQVLVARMHNETGLTRSVSIHVHPYYERDIQVIDTDDLAVSAREAISDPLLRALPASGTFSQIGNFVQLSDPPQMAPIVATFYRQVALRG